MDTKQIAVKQEINRLRYLKDILVKYKSSKDANSKKNVENSYEYDISPNMYRKIDM